MVRWSESTRRKDLQTERNDLRSESSASWSRTRRRRSSVRRERIGGDSIENCGKEQGFFAKIIVF